MANSYVETATCGTRSGYNRHLRHREPACQPCKDAAAEYQRNRGGSVRPASEIVDLREWRIVDVTDVPPTFVDFCAERGFDPITRTYR